MTLVGDSSKMKECPLCLRKFHILEEKGKTGKVYLVCNWCKIILWIRDAFIGHWEEFEDVPCPVCGEHKMRFFVREDFYCKWKCPKCSAEIERYDPDLHRRVVELRSARDGTPMGPDRIVQ